jgi:hypothetical protein
MRMKKMVLAERPVNAWRKRGVRGKTRRTIIVARVRLKVRTRCKKVTCVSGFLSHCHQSLPLPVT